MNENRGQKCEEELKGIYGRFRHMEREAEMMYAIKLQFKNN